MGVVERFEAMNRYGKKTLWRARAAVKKAVKNGGRVKKHIKKFQYDPSSYALNFDDGGGAANNISQNFSGGFENITWVYVHGLVLWVKP